MTAASFAAILLSRKRVVYRLRPVDCNARPGAHVKLSVHFDKRAA